MPEIVSGRVQLGGVEDDKRAAESVSECWKDGKGVGSAGYLFAAIESGSISGWDRVVP